MTKDLFFADELFNSEIAPIWDFLSNWRVELSFSLSGGRCVWKELYEEYRPQSINDIFNKLENPSGSLPHYRFYCDGLIPAYKAYADGRLFSKVSPRKYKDRQIRGGVYPWDRKSDDTVFEIYLDEREDKRLSVGGRHKEEAKSNWNILNRKLNNFFNPKSDMYFKSRLQHWSGPFGLVNCTSDTD